MSHIPRDWTMMPLGDVATLQRGFDLPIQDRHEGPVKIFAANGPIGTHNVHKVRGPGVVTGRSGTLGKVHYVERDFWPLNTALWVKDFHGNDPAWVYRLLTWMRLEKFTRGAGVPTLNRNLVHVVEVPLPPLAEQKRIAGILDAADALRVKRRECLAQLDIFLQSTFLDMFGDPVTNPMGWEVEPLKELLGEKSINGAYYPKEAYSDDGIPMVHMADAFYGVVNPGNARRVDVPIADVEKYGLLPTDLLVSRRSLTYEGSAKPCLIPETDEPLIFESSLIRVRPDRGKVLTIYLFHYLQNERARASYVFPLVTRSTISGINQSNLMKVKVVLPPLDLQHRFVAIVESVEQQMASQRAHLDELDTLFASLQSRAFRGDL